MNTEWNKILEYALSLPSTVADHPFEDDFITTVLRHTDTGKWFGRIMMVTRSKVGLDGDGQIGVLNLKCDMEDSLIVREMFDAIIPAYHMNKNHWISIILNYTVPSDVTETLIDRSYDLTAKKTKSRKGNK